MAPDLNWELRLGFLVHDVSRLRRRVVDRALKPLGVTRSQWWVLAFLSRSDGMSQVALADELDLGKVALGQLIDRLEKTGFVSRRADDEDRRVKRVFLTRRGQALIARIRESVTVDGKGNPRKDRRDRSAGDRPRAAQDEGESARHDRRERGERRLRRGLAPSQAEPDLAAIEHHDVALHRPRAEAHAAILEQLDADRVAGIGRRGETDRHRHQPFRPPRREMLERRAAGEPECVEPVRDRPLEACLLGRFRGRRGSA